MATVNFFVCTASKNRGAGAGTTFGGPVRISGQDAITTVENLEDGSGDITVTKGEILAIYSTAALRMNFGGTAATGTTGVYVPATTLFDYEVPASGNVSVIEAA